MNDASESAIRWYANPRNWELAESKSPGPYSASVQSHTAIDRGAEARRQLNKRGTYGGLLQLVLELTGENTMKLARKTSIHPGRLEDLIQDAADPLPNERVSIATALGISPNECK